MNILFCFYREWAESIYQQIKYFFKSQKNMNFDFIKSNDDLNKINIKKYNLIFFIGWSDLVKEDIINSVPCICLHPSKLPQYRGGSPIQHQIINGEEKSAVTFFLMNSELDTGDIIRQTEFQLDGDLEEIFSKIQDISYSEILSIIAEYEINKKFISRKKQDNTNSTTYKRRTKKMSEIFIDDFKNFTAEQLFNKIRCLQDPYPNAFIRCKDDTILYITKAKI